MSKTIENIVHDRRYMYLEKSFNKSRLKNACDKSLYTGIYLDHQKAFYKVNQNILLENLKHYGIKGISFCWFKSFIWDRVQYTSIDLKESLTKIVRFSWSSTRLSLLFFFNFINDLNKSVKNAKIHRYSDDTNLLLRKKPLKKLINK